MGPVVPVAGPRGNVDPDRAVVVMGVAGAGKSTVGALLAGRLGVPHVDADRLHPPANLARMAAGAALTDADRWPWLAAVAAVIGRDNRVVVSCSALKRRYRDVLRDADPDAWFLHLVLDQPAATARVAARRGHFLPAGLVSAQFVDLEPLAGEAALAVDAGWPPERIVGAALTALASGG